MRIGLILTIFPVILLSSIAAAYNPGDVQWASGSSATLRLNNNFSNRDYMVKAVGFPSPVMAQDRYHPEVPAEPVTGFVKLELYKNGVLLKDDILLTLVDSSYTSPDDEVKVTVTGLPSSNSKDWVYESYNPWASVTLQLRGKPKLEISISTDKSEYTSHSDLEIKATYTIKNTGSADAKNLDFTINLGDLRQIRGESLTQHLVWLKKDETSSITIGLEVPKLQDSRSFTTSATATGYDIKDAKYTANSSKSISITTSIGFTIQKTVVKSMYLKDPAIVTLTAGNSGPYDLVNIHITDTIPVSFILQTDTRLAWDIPILKPGQPWSTAYTLKALEANKDGFTLPAASAQYTRFGKTATVQSNTPSVIVHGPKINLTKTVNTTMVKIGGEVVVSIYAKNTGDVPTKIEITDQLPEGVSLVNGKTSLPAILMEAGMSQNITYTIKMNTLGEITLPPATANYTELEYKGTLRGVVSSQVPIIKVVDQETPIKPTSTPIETTRPPEILTEKPKPQPGFEGIFAILVLLIVYILRR